MGFQGKILRLFLEATGHWGNIAVERRLYPEPCEMEKCDWLWSNVVRGAKIIVWNVALPIYELERFFGVHKSQV
jgi:hypothetical protein